MTARQQLAADGGIFGQAATAQFLEIDRCFVVVELADEIVAICNGGPAKKRIGLPLHGTLALSNTLSLMCRGVEAPHRGLRDRAHTPSRALL